MRARYGVDSSVQNRRLFFMAVLLIAAFCGLGFRLVDLHVLRRAQLRAEAEDNTQRTTYRESRRGEIRDARGNVLAQSLFGRKVCVNPSLVGPHAPVLAKALSPILELPEEALIRKLQPRFVTKSNGQSIPVQYDTLKPKVSLETWERVRSALTNLTFGVDEKSLKRNERIFYANLRSKAVYSETEQIRIYPNGSLAGHVIGFCGLDEGGSARSQDIVGKSGIELTCNSALTGVEGWRSSEYDSRSRELVAFREQDVSARDGLNVVLTMDAGVQHILETELIDAVKEHSPLSASGIILRPKTGQILAMASYPWYDPGNPGATPPSTWRNRLITDVAEPGSTFKIVTIAAALDEGIIRLNDVFDCENGRFFFAGRVLKDHHPYGAMSVENILAKSSNIGTAKVGIKLGAERLHRRILDFGFGTPTGLPINGEVGGIVHATKYWSKLSISRIPIGQGIAVTPLQMALAMGVIANEGRLMKPMLVDRLEDDQGRVIAQYQPQTVRQVIKPSTARLMVAALKEVVSTNGTAQGARLERYSVAGKTGTAQKAERGQYVPGKYYASFIGFFPADRPEVLISIVLDEPRTKGYYGGLTAGPVFQKVAERCSKYLALPPDLAPEPPKPPRKPGPATPTLARRVSR